MNDYAKIAKAIDFIRRHAGDQPSLASIAAHVHLSPAHFQRLFCRWAGVSPKKYLQVLTVEKAKNLLAHSQSLLEVTDAVGLSSSSRLYDHFVKLEAVTPGEYKSGGAGVEVQYGVGDTPFGRALIAFTQRGICRLTFIENDNVATLLQELKTQWPLAEIKENKAASEIFLNRLFTRCSAAAASPLSLHVAGTNFQIHVWRELLRLSPGELTSYSRLAQTLNKPGAARAVGNAVGANPVAFLIPCHRVIQQSGNLGGYRWGETRKLAIQAWEAAQIDERT